MSVSYLLKYIFYVFIIFCLVSHRFPVGIRVLNGGRGGGGSPGPEFARLFHDNPACRTPVISNPKTIFFPNSASCAKILANPASRVTVNSRIPSINFAFSRIPGQIPDTEKLLLDSTGSAWRLYLLYSCVWQGQCLKRHLSILRYSPFNLFRLSCWQKNFNWSYL